MVSPHATYRQSEQVTTPSSSLLDEPADLFHTPFRVQPYWLCLHCGDSHALLMIDASSRAVGLYLGCTGLLPRPAEERRGVIIEPLSIPPCVNSAEMRTAVLRRCECGS
jgi:hypothetical protein